MDQLIDHERRIAELERKVWELSKRAGESEPATGFASDHVETAPASVSALEDPRLLELVQGGDQLAAIKLYRELTGAGLAESKDAVDQLMTTYRPAG